ncbi:hypothetical protein TNCV_3083411 [Trichonephila clavipes]|nr:hypothetical protein TNCV_3083411 [Trichonephila clavipes]
MTMPVEKSLNGMCNARFTVWVSGAVDYESTIAQFLPYDRASRLAWAREHRSWRVKDWRRVAMSCDSDYLTPTGG